MDFNMDASEKEAIDELLAMTDDELALVDHTVVKWICQGKGCSRGTKIRDYGIAPMYFHPRKSIRWINLERHYWMCEKHFTIVKRLRKQYTPEHIERRLFDFTKAKL